MAQNKCTICWQMANEEPIGDSFKIVCPRCGIYRISVTARQLRTTSTDFPKHYDAIASHQIRRAQRSTEPLLVTTETLSTWKSERLPTAPELCRNFLLWVGDASEAPGNLTFQSAESIRAEIGAMDKPDGLSFAVEMTSKKEWVERKGDVDGKFCCRLTLDGWVEYERQKRIVSTSRRAFMAMSFRHAELKEALEKCFKPATAAAGFELRILTDEQGAGLIDDQLRVALRTSRFVVADLTHANLGAYWEAGFAEGLERPVFYTCDAGWFHDKSKGTHFDTNHMNTVVWKYGQWDDAARRLTAMIRATLPGEAKMTDG